MGENKLMRVKFPTNLSTQKVNIFPSCLASHQQKMIYFTFHHFLFYNFIIFIILFYFIFIWPTEQQII